MAKKKKAEGKKGLDEWMATYSDMVTLLMCFFVMLYASSTPDETKFQYIFQAFNTSGTYINPFVSEENPDENSASDTDGNSDEPSNNGEGGSSSEETDQTGGLPDTFEALFAWTQQEIDTNNLAAAVSMDSSSTRIYIRFDNDIMFEGDSAVLLDSGKQALKKLFPGIKAVSKYIKTIRITGHTAEGISLVNQWDLSAARACSVLKYMDFASIVDSSKYYAEGRGQYDPIADNSTEEGRAQNRRVELVIIRDNTSSADTQILQDILLYDYGVGQEITDPEDRDDNNTGVDNDAIQDIIDSIDDKYGDHPSYVDPETDEQTGPSRNDDILIGDDDMYEVDGEGNPIIPEETTASTAETEPSQSAS